jgi:hypothetical protein
MNTREPSELLKRRIFFLMEEIGINPIKTFRFMMSLPWIAKDFLTFRKQLRLSTEKHHRQAILRISPFAHDRNADSGAQKSLYFLQDICCSQYCLNKPFTKHIDLGSRVDGFVAQIAASREIEVLDIRPSNSNIKNIIFTKGDITSLDSRLTGLYDLTTSLHALEHVGLGRYGDKVDANGFNLSLQNIRSLTSNKGETLISLPVSSCNAEIIEFNAQRIMSSSSIIERLLETFGEDRLIWWCLADSSRAIHSGQDIKTLERALGSFSGLGFVATSWEKNDAHS